MKKTLQGFDDSRGHYIFPSSFPGEEEMIGAKSKKDLTALIFQNIQEKEERESRLSQLEEMTEREGENEIFRFLTATWR